MATDPIWTYAASREQNLWPIPGSFLLFDFVAHLNGKNYTLEFGKILEGPMDFRISEKYECVACIQKYWKHISFWLKVFLLKGKRVHSNSMLGPCVEVFLFCMHVHTYEVKTFSMLSVEKHHNCHHSLKCWFIHPWTLRTVNTTSGLSFRLLLNLLEYQRQGWNCCMYVSIPTHSGMSSGMDEKCGHLWMQSRKCFIQ
jgi:hypothetical protein